MTTRPDIVSAFELAHSMLQKLTAVGIKPSSVQATSYGRPVYMGIAPERLDEAAEVLDCGPAYAPEAVGNVYRENGLVTLYTGRDRWQTATGRRPVTS